MRFHGAEILLGVALGIHQDGTTHVTAFPKGLGHVRLDSRENLAFANFYATGDEVLQIVLEGGIGGAVLPASLQQSVPGCETAVR